MILADKEQRRLHAPRIQYASVKQKVGLHQMCLFRKRRDGVYKNVRVSKIQKRYVTDREHFVLSK